MGLDISSKCVGYAIFDDDKLKFYGKYIQQGKHHGEKLHNYYNWLESLLRLYNPDHLLIEAPYRSKTLFQYSAVAPMVYYKVYNKELPKTHYLYPITIKTQLAVPTSKDHDRNKQIMVDFVNKLFGLTLRFLEKPTKKSYTDDDIADAIALVVAWRRRSKRDDGGLNTKQNSSRKRAGKTKKRR